MRRAVIVLIPNEQLPFFSRFFKESPVEAEMQKARTYPSSQATATATADPAYPMNFTLTTTYVRLFVSPLHNTSLPPHGNVYHQRRYLCPMHPQSHPDGHDALRRGGVKTTSQPSRNVATIASKLAFTLITFGFPDSRYCCHCATTLALTKLHVKPNELRPYFPSAKQHPRD